MQLQPLAQSELYGVEGGVTNWSASGGGNVAGGQVSGLGEVGLWAGFGALVGGSAGGPVGALIGGLIGALFGWL
jgi:hypothetical protein